MKNALVRSLQRRLNWISLAQSHLVGVMASHGYRPSIAVLTIAVLLYAGALAAGSAAY